MIVKYKWRWFYSNWNISEKKLMLKIEFFFEKYEE